MAEHAPMHATAFGLDIDAATPLSFLRHATAKPTGRQLSISVHRAQAAREIWPQDSELICDERLPDGGVNYRIETHPDHGYLISGPEYGAHLLSADGRRLRCFPEGRPDGGWQRMLVAQVLPFAALLHGLEVFHASAVVRAFRRGAAFANPSFVQFHPTCLPVSGEHQSKLTLMSESLRNDGRVWVPLSPGDAAILSIVSSTLGARSPVSAEMCRIGA